MSEDKTADPFQQWSKLAPRLGAAARETLDELVQTLLTSPLQLPLLLVKLARDATLRPEIGPVLNDPSFAFTDRTARLLALLIGKLDEDIAKQELAVKGQPGATSTSIDVEMQKLKRMVDRRNQTFDMLNSILRAQGEAMNAAARRM